MKLFGISLGDPAGPKKSAAKSSRLFDRLAGTLRRFQVVLALLVVGGLLAFTGFTMLGFVSPEPDEERIAENNSKLKRIRIDPEVVERIKNLSDSRASVEPQFDSDRNNPFSE